VQCFVEFCKNTGTEMEKKIDLPNSFSEEIKRGLALVISGISVKSTGLFWFVML